jgi:hypothetical protein
MNDPKFGGVNQDHGCAGTVLLYSSSQLAGSAAIKFPQQLQVQNILF